MAYNDKGKVKEAKDLVYQLTAEGLEEIIGPNSKLLKEGLKQIKEENKMLSKKKIEL